MPGDATQKRRIVRLWIEAGDREIRGTGFVIGPRHLLTAFHVIGNRVRRERFRHVKTQLELDPNLRFEGPGPKDYPTTAAVIAGDPDLDWALLECAAEIPGCDPFALRGPPRAKDPWDSYGFAGARDVPGKAYSGTVTSDDPEIQLFCGEAYQGARVPGLSGAPCIVDGHAVGIIVCASDPEGTGYVKDGAMFIRPLADVAARCPTVKALMPPACPPFVRQVKADLLRPGVATLLEAAGELARLPAVKIDAERLAPLVAEKILLRRPRAAVALLEPLTPQLDPVRAQVILNLTASVWIDPGAAQVLADAILATTPRTIIGINAETPDLGERFVHRAGYPTAHHPGWQNRLRTLNVADGERRTDDFIAQARERLAQLLPSTDARLEEDYDDEDDHRERPLILVVPPRMPAADAVTRLHARFPMVRVVLLCGAGGLDELIARFPTATIVRPQLGPGDEDRAGSQYVKALEMIAKCYETLRPKATP